MRAAAAGIPQRPPLAERDGELAALGDLVSAAAGGAGHLVLVAGPPGIGKSALADRLADLGHAAGMQVLVAHASAAEAGARSGWCASSWPTALAVATAWGTGGARARALRSLAATQPPEDAVGTLRAALDAGPPVLDAGWVRHDLGSSLARLGRRHDAEAELRVALDAGHRCGAGLLAAHARARLVDLGYRPRRSAASGIDALTGSERRVATLAAGGRTNREIAEALFVTRRTVETHLTAAYRKLGVESRAGLATTIGTTPAPVRPAER